MIAQGSCNFERKKNSILIIHLKFLYTADFILGFQMYIVSVLKNMCVDKDFFQFCWLMFIFNIVNEFNVFQGYNERKFDCNCVYSAYILKPVLSGRNL